MRRPDLQSDTIMGAIEDIHEDLDADVSLEEFREAVEEKVEQMGGLADEETAAMLVAHELDEEEVEGVADVEPGMEEVTFIAKVVGIGDLRTFERDDDGEEGRVINVEVADESGTLRAAFWDGRAQAIDDGEIEVGDVLKIEGRPQEGLNGVEVSVDRADVDEDAEVDVDLRDTYRVEDLSLGLSDVDLLGKLLDTDSIRTFERDDGSEGRVSNLVVGDETGRIRVTLWDERADLAEELEPGVSVEVVDGYVRERDGDLELHVGDRGTVEVVDEEIHYEPDTTDVADVEIGETVDLAGVVRSADSKRTFERDDGSEGQVRNVRVQDGTGDIRVALWGEKADVDLGPGDEVHLEDVRIEDGWQDDVEAAANWRSSVRVVDEARPEPTGDGAEGDESDGTGLDAFAGDGGTATDDGGSAAASGGTADGGGSAAGAATDEAAATGGSDDTADEGDGGVADRPHGEDVSFTGTVVQAGDPVVLDDGEETLAVETDADVTLGQDVTVRGSMRDGRLDADEVL